ncbi:two-component system, OmpR family, sensor histidine kinase ChvG [Limimonas halophila]|uniref:histidine kinase n=1 Tax=Limimonas halophila TaxID=1082479 RepID=A0A1G7PWY9_9PROT|nr:stimulus-sensing domain-containing protein [Limimonas halophila]SDF90149.1 two-component system, OmpR family, sensor histidine kinase ChvG [Limimonas halophila]
MPDADTGTSQAAGEQDARRTVRAAGRRRHRQAWRSPLLWRILAINVLVLLIPVLGLLHLQQYRESLIGAELSALRTQARAFSTTLANSAAVVSASGQERLLPEATRHALRVLAAGRDIRARVFTRDGRMMADSFALLGAGGQVRVEHLPPPDSTTFLPAALSDAYRWVLRHVPGVGEFPRYRENAVQSAEDYRAVERALEGEGAGRVYRNGEGGLVLTVASPVQRYRKVLGALMISRNGTDIQAAVRDRRTDILIVFGIALGVTLLLSFYMTRAIARPMRRLAEAADAVRHARGRQANIPDLSQRGDEIGDLSAALNEMTEALWDRLDAIERFAADVAHEIKNPLTSLRSAVETVSRVDDPEQQKKLMGIILEDVQRLDHLISEISDASRLDAELSRAETAPVELARLLEALVEVQRAGAEETGPAFELHLPHGADGERDALIVPGLEARVAQVFRNLIANAATFCPPNGTIAVTARRVDGWVEVTVDDEGPGVPEAKLQAIFERFYTDRPTAEKAGTHSGLGLAICKQIVDAHRGTITAENRRDADGTITGARFTVRLPAQDQR